MAKQWMKTTSTTTITNKKNGEEKKITNCSNNGLRHWKVCLLDIRSVFLIISIEFSRLHSLKMPQTHRNQWFTLKIPSLCVNCIPYKIDTFSHYTISFSTINDFCLSCAWFGFSSLFFYICVFCWIICKCDCKFSYFFFIEIPNVSTGSLHSTIFCGRDKTYMCIKRCVLLPLYFIRCATPTIFKLFSFVSFFFRSCLISLYLIRLLLLLLLLLMLSLSLTMPMLLLPLKWVYNFNFNCVFVCWP